jgi:hypothetical protein
MLIFVLAITSQGCGGTDSVPILLPPAAITVNLQQAPEWGLDKPMSVKVKANDLEKVYKLIKPFRPKNQGIDKEANTLIAEITVTQEDGSRVKMYFRWYGTNPALVSFDDKKYYYAEFPKVGDGVADLLKILRTK